MEDLPYRQRCVAVEFKVLRQRGKVACADSPVGVEVVQSGGVWPSTCKERRSAWATYCLLRREREVDNRIHVTRVYRKRITYYIHKYP